jgi:pimeloyl-ACP methyl ester carboxylesterase
MILKNRAAVLAVLWVTAIAGSSFFLAASAPVARAANLYAQYADGGISGGGFLAMDGAYGTGSGEVKYVQVELDITNDEQRGTSYYCPVAPNTGVLIFVFRGDGYVYVHCVTSTEAAGKLGRKAVYTFDDAHFGYGGGDGWSMEFASQGAFTAEVYGAADGNGSFYPYLVLADDGGTGSPATIGSLAQYSAGVTTTLPENGLADGSAVMLSGVPQSFFASDTVAFQAEVEPFDVPFTGIPTAVSGEGPAGATMSVTITHLAPGAYHWAGRSVDVTGGYYSAWTEYRVAGNIDFNIPTSTAREPVVIVPGVLGSRLARASDGGEVWPNPEEMISSAGDQYLDFLKMNGDGTPAADRAVVASDILREATATFLGITFDSVFYKNLVDGLVADGYTEGTDLFVAPYDWRLGIESSTATLAEKISQAVAASPDGKVNIVAHSMGGLLVKQYLAGRADTSFVDKVVLAGVPQLGAPKAWKLLNYGDDLGLNWFGIGLNQDEMKDVAANMPAAYELLPSRRYVGISGGYVQDFRNGGGGVLGYDETPAPNATLAATADLFHGGLDMQPVNASSVYNIVGCGRPTLTGFNLYDGTVPEASAMDLADSFHNYFVLGDATGVDHAGLVRDTRPLTLIKSIFDGDGTAASSSLPEGITAALSDCFADGTAVAAAMPSATTVEFSTHSPVALDAYDEQGRHTGVTASGMVETNIPSSEYERIGENSFVLLPALPDGAAYRIVDHALASGAFTMKVKGYDGDAVAQAATYLSVPLASASATAELTFSGFGGDMTLQLDNDGDGVADTAIVPSAELSSPSLAADVTPPDITLPVIPERVMRGSTTTLTFGAIDAESGVATLRATLNGAEVVNSAAVTFSALGNNVFTLTAVDRAGNPRTGEIDFDVVAPATSSVTLPADIDTYLSRRSANQNYGSAPTLRVGGQEDDRTLVNFGWGGLKDMIDISKIVSAHLVFTAAGDAANGATANGKGKNAGPPAADALYLFPAYARWSEYGATWNCPEDHGTMNNKRDCPRSEWPATPSAQPVIYATTTEDGVSFDVTEDVHNIYTGAIMDYGWMVAEDGKQPLPLAEFASRETASGPQLVVIYEESQ